MSLAHDLDAAYSEVAVAVNCNSLNMLHELEAKVMAWQIPQEEKCQFWAMVRCAERVIHA